jgi:hypothetical protein
MGLVEEEGLVHEVAFLMLDVKGSKFLEQVELQILSGRSAQGSPIHRLGIE